MREELELKLVKKYPIIFKDYKGDMRETCMAWGIATGDGWYDIINDLCQTITKIIGKKDFKVIADQVKEKFGGLRFYYHMDFEPNIFDGVRGAYAKFMCHNLWGIAYNKTIEFKKKFYKTIPEKIDDAVTHAEHLSYITCETCGAPGKRRSGGWIRTLCDKCGKKINEK